MRKAFDKDMILQAAMDLAREVGFRKLTMRSLASKLNCSVMPIYDAYESKDHLIQDVFDSIVRENNSAPTYFERNRQVLLNGIRSPQLFRDIKKYSSSSSEFLAHYEETIELMAKDQRFEQFSYEACKSIYFDLLIYISGLVDRQFYVTEVVDEPEEFWLDIFDGFTEVLYWVMRKLWNPIKYRLKEQRRLCSFVLPKE